MRFVVKGILPMVTHSRALTVILFSCMLLGAIAQASTHTAASCNVSDVQTAINSAVSGDTVNIPAGTCSWSSGVSVSGKGITVTGAGSGRIIAHSSTAATIGTGSKTLSVSGSDLSTTLNIATGTTLKISELGNRQNYMQGTVTSYSSGTLVINVTSTGGSCGNSSSTQSPSNCKRWLVSTIPSTVLINNSTSAMFSVTEDSTVHTNLSGFKIQAGTGTGNGVNFNAGGGEAIVLHDCWIEQGSGDSVWTGISRGLIYNCSFDSTPFSMAQLGIHLQPLDETAWATTSYFGTNDTNGQHNFYVEDSDFHAYLNAVDNDEGARSVFRYNLFNNAGFGTHGVDTGPIGQRYFEYYNNVGVFDGYNDGTTFPMNWWMFVRGGTFIVHDNTLPVLVSTDYGTKSTVNMTVMNLQRSAGPNPCWGLGTSGGANYHAPRQVGLGNVTGTGHDGLGRTSYSAASYGYLSTEYVGDPEPAYIWNNSTVPLNNVSTSDYGTGQPNSCTGTTDSSANYIKLNRDYYNGSTAKPGYTPYTYPHPLRQNTVSGGGSSVSAPSGLQAAVN